MGKTGMMVMVMYQLFKDAMLAYVITKTFDKCLGTPTGLVLGKAEDAIPSSPFQ